MGTGGGVGAGVDDHLGVGAVVLQDEGRPVVIGKNGARDLTDGSVSGDDPLIPYGNVDNRAVGAKNVTVLNSTFDGNYEANLSIRANGLVTIRKLTSINAGRS